MELIKKFISHELVSGSIYLLIGSMLSNLFAFLLNLFLARSLSYEDYAIFASLLSIIYLAFIPAGSLNAVIVKFATKYFTQGETTKVSAFYKLSFKLTFFASSIVLIIFIILAYPITMFLHIKNIWYGIILSATVSIFYLNSLNLAFLQSLMQFGFISFINTFSGIIKLFAGILLVIAGFGAFSGLWSIFFMTLGSFLIAYIPLRKIIFLKNKQSINLPRKEILKYSIPAFLITFFLTSFTSIDIILVKHFFSPQQAGFYAGLSLIGKVIFYFTAPIPLVMFPLLVKRYTSGFNFVNLFYGSLILVFIPSALISFFYFLFPNFIVNLFLGGRDYLYISQYLGLFGIYLTVFSLVNVCVNFFLSLNKTKIIYLVMFFSLIQIVLISFFHNNFYEVITVSLLCISFLFIFLIYYFIASFRDFTKIKANSVPAGSSIV